MAETKKTNLRKSPQQSEDIQMNRRSRKEKPPVLPQGRFSAVLSVPWELW